MTTHGILRFLLNHAHKRWSTVIAVALCVTVTAGCSVRVEGRAEYEAAGACEQAYYAAHDAYTTVHSSDPLFVRYVASAKEQHNWLDVAIQCPTRFTEGTLRSAQAQYTTWLLASQIGIAYQPLTVNSLDDISKMDISATALSSMALAEDRAGFASEVIAARWAATSPSGLNEYATSLAANTASKLLSLSDDHKETASQLMYIAGKDAKDLRRKVYATTTITAHPVTVLDPATGIDANTLAVVELNTTRAELQAMNDDAYATQDVSTNSSLRADLLQLSMLMATHAYKAFRLGYPNVDALLYEQ